MKKQSSSYPGMPEMRDYFPCLNDHH